MTDLSKKYRRKILESAVESGRGHIGGAFSSIDILIAIHEIMEKNDKFILSKGHAAIALYSILCENMDEFCKDGSVYTEHPSVLIPKIRLTTGSLGHGIGIAAGAALARKMDDNTSRVFVLVGDGECMEGSVYESMLFAVSNKLDNLTIIIDNNSLISTDKLSESIDYKKIFSSVGCICIELDGHDPLQLRKYLGLYYPNKPTVIIAKTIKGKGISFMENNIQWHSGIPKGEQLEQALKELQ